MKKTLFLILVAVFLNSYSFGQVFEKTFDDEDLNSGGWVDFSVTGDDETWHVPGTTYGHNDTYCAKMSGYDNESVENEDWLISPSFNTDDYSSLNLTFWNAKSDHDGLALQAYYSDNYSGSGDPTSATWTEITGLNLSSGGYDWIESTHDLSSITGTDVYIGFKYTSSSSLSCIWELDDIVLTSTSDISELNNSINIFPNPTIDVINLTNINLFDNVTITNICGQNMFESDFDVEKMEIDVSQYTAGMYIVTLRGENVVYTQKFVKE